MTGAAITLALPPRRGGAWADGVLDRVWPDVLSLAAAWGLGRPGLVVLRSGERPALLQGGVGRRLPDLDDARAMAEAITTTMAEEAWRLLLMPALAARGIPAEGSVWLEVAATRGLCLDTLAQLAAGGATEAQIAWRLAALPPPRISTLVALGRTIDGFGEEERRAAAQQAASWTGIPIPLPEPPAIDPALGTGAGAGGGEGSAALALGARLLRCPEPAAMAQVLARAAGALIDPGLAVALAADPARLQRRLAARVLAKDGAVALAEAMVRAHAGFDWPLDLVGLAEGVAGLAPAPLAEAQ